MAVCLRKIAPLAAVACINILAEQTKVIGKAHQVVEILNGFINPAYAGEDSASK